MWQLALALTRATACVAEQCDVGEDGPLLQARQLGVQHQEADALDLGERAGAKVQALSGATAGMASSDLDSENAASSGVESENAEVLGLMASSSVWEDLEKAPAKFWASAKDKYANRFGDAVLREKVEAAEVPVLSEEERLALASTAGARRVLSALTDTIICSPAVTEFQMIRYGMDTNCRKGAVFQEEDVYPGVAQFQLELGLGPVEDENATAPPFVVPMSARPQELKFLLALTPTDGILSEKMVGILSEKMFGRPARPHVPKFQRYGNLSEKMFGSKDAWGIDLVNAQYGSIWSSPSVARDDFDAHLPWLEFTAWLNVRSLGGFPTIFVGDNGRGDARAAELMLSQKTTVEGDVAGPLLGAFIHHVQPLRIDSAVLNTSSGSGRDGTRATLASYGIHLFHNYGHAACIAYKNGFISDAGYRRIMSSILQECNMTFPSWRWRRPLCGVLKGEFELPTDRMNDWGWALDHGQLISIRSPDDCSKSTSSLEGLLRAEEVFMVGGSHMVGRCDELDSDLITRLIATKKQQSKLESGYVYWAIDEGPYCITPCGQSCDRVAIKERLWSRHPVEPNWKLLKSRRMLEGLQVTCPNPLQRSRICQIVLSL